MEKEEDGEVTAPRGAVTRISATHSFPDALDATIIFDQSPIVPETCTYQAS